MKVRRIVPECVKRIAALLLLSAVLCTLCACGGSGYSIKEPYDYGVDTQTEEWEALTARQRREAYSIPQEIIDDMTTEALLRSVLDNPFLSDAWAFSTGEQMVEVTEQITQKLELTTQS